MSSDPSENKTNNNMNETFSKIVVDVHSSKEMCSDGPYADMKVYSETGEIVRVTRLMLFPD